MDQEREEQESFFLPAEDQRIFGAGIKRKRVPFVPASSATTAHPTSPPKPAQAAGDRYLSIVMKNQNPPESIPIPADAQAPLICEICNQPLLIDSQSQPQSQSHESSIAHQVCLTHSHPPSHLPRSHVGLKYLSTYGWDPDSRLGLGASGDGIRIPIKGKVKNDTVGLGVESLKWKKSGKESKILRLNAKEVRKQEAEQKKRAERLREGFYGKDLAEYLGPDG